LVVAPVVSISILSTKKLSTRTSLGREKAYVPVTVLLVTVTWFAVPVIEDTKLAPDYRIRGRILIVKLTISYVNCEFAQLQ